MVKPASIGFSICQTRGREVDIQHIPFNGSTECRNVEVIAHPGKSVRRENSICSQISRRLNIRNVFKLEVGEWGDCYNLGREACSNGRD